jgi:hypothetical protein
MRTLAEEQAEIAAAREQKRVARRKRRLRRLLTWAVAASVAISAAVLTVIGLGEVRCSAVWDAVRLLGRVGDDFPVSGGAGAMRQADMLGGALVLLGAKTLDIYSKEAYHSLSFPQNYAAPAFRAAQGRVLLFDRGAGRLALLSRTAVLYEKNLTQRLLGGDLNARGDVAVATIAEAGTSEAHVWNARGRECFAWRCDKEYITALRLAKNGRGLAMCLTGTAQAAVYARFVFFPFGAEQPQIDLRFEGAWLSGMERCKDGWLLFGDQAVYLVRDDGSSEAYSFEGRPLQAFAAQEGGLSAVLLQALGSSSSLLRVFDEEGALLSEETFSMRSADLRCAAGRIYLRFGDRLYCREEDGSYKRSRVLPVGLEAVFADGKRLVVISVAGIEVMQAGWEETDITELA